MEKPYSIDLVIPWFMTDPQNRLKPASFMEIAQEMANEGARRLGFGFDVLDSHGAAWVLTRVHIIFHDTPLWRDNANVATWHKGLHGPFFIRDFRLLDANGSTRVSATTSWVVMDTNARKLIRAEEMPSIIPSGPQCPDDAITEPVRKLVFPKGLNVNEAPAHEVSYTDLDPLGHTNNARYLAWAMDCIPPEVSLTQPVREVFLNIHKETHIGEKVSFRVAREDIRTDDNASSAAFWVEGSAAGMPVFIAKVVF